jgi:hypothetical protein
MLGTYAHMKFAHEFGCVSHKHRRQVIVRRIHRMLGKTLLAVAVLQISLGLGQYDAAIWSKMATGVFNLAAGFLLYTGLVWAGIAMLEYRHRRLYQRHRSCGGLCGGAGDDDLRSHVKDFKPMTGAGYCNEKDIRANTTLYLLATKLVDQIMEVEQVVDKWANIEEWVAQGGKAEFSGAAKLFRVPLRLVYLYGHRSMKTSEILDYVRYLDSRYREIEKAGAKEGKQQQSSVHVREYRNNIQELMNEYYSSRDNQQNSFGWTAEYGGEHGSNNVKFVKGVAMSSEMEIEL